MTIDNIMLQKIKEINLIINNNLKAIGFLNNQYVNSRSKVIVECQIHGSCPICAVEKADLQNCLKNIHHFDSKRNLYFITFKNLKNNEIFYKIGVSTENGCLRRFKQLKKDNLEIIKADEIITKNIFALLTEYYVLTHFK